MFTQTWLDDNEDKDESEDNEEAEYEEEDEDEYEGKDEEKDVHPSMAGLGRIRQR